MTDEPSQADASQASDLPATSDEDQRRMLELQLIKVRSEAEAARLDARAAEIELMIRQLSGKGAPTTESGVPINPPHHAVSPATQPSETAPQPGSAANPPFGSWGDVREVIDAAAAPRDHAGAAEHDARGVTETAAPGIITRSDAAHATTPMTHFDDLVEQPAGEAREGSNIEIEAQVDQPVESSAADPLFPNGVIETDSQPAPQAVAADLAIESEEHDDDDTDQRRRPAAWLVSAVVHVAVVLILAAVTLQAHHPKDQVALTASAPEANEVSMETFSLETNEPEPEVSEPTTTETAYELSDLGEISAVEFKPETPPAPPSSAAASLSSNSSAAAMSLSSDSEATMEFCGVEGGGNHFVYLVDSSGSMGNAFESARAELLHSIDLLKSDQRFYVVFFDTQSDYMRLASSDVDEPRSVYATSKNKAALQRWAMRISKDRGRAPYDPLRFALKLKPDVVFLLSDGEFPQGIEDLLKEENKTSNLFGDSKPICIVHTIGYHSKEGESRMRRIAEQNQGQYRHVPKP